MDSNDFSKPQLPPTQAPAPRSGGQISITINTRTLQLAAFILAVAAAAWLVSHNPLSTNANPVPTGNPSSIVLPGFGPSIVTADELKQQVSATGIPTYWAGEKSGTHIELTITTNGNIYVRYLPLDVGPGSKDTYFTVATMYDPAAFANVQGLAAQTGAKWTQYSGGALVAASSESDHNIYFAYKDVPVLIDVYAPDPNDGWKQIESGEVTLLQ